MGLSIRSLWGPEGRWALIVKGMLQSGNYFVPKVYGIIDFDKPLLSHWIMLPLVRSFGLTESVLRIPGALAGIATVLLIFVIGKRLFGTVAGVLASLVLMTSAMFVFWARVASAELFNLLGIWFMFWCFLAGAQEGRLKYVLLLYGSGAIAAFFKGPVAPALSVSALLSYSVITAVLRWKDVKSQDKGSESNPYRRFFGKEFLWIASWQGLAGVFVGTVVFLFLLLLPVLITGSWLGVQLMWKENVLRFFSPFDHRGPVYTYLVYGVMFSAPWTFLVVGSLLEIKRLDAGEPRRWTALVATAIFLFFTLSGSRRSYYILPLVPALALITGAVVSRWLETAKKNAWRLMRSAAFATSALITIAGVSILYAIIYLYPVSAAYRYYFIAVSLSTLLAGLLGMYLLIRRKEKECIALIFLFVFLLDLGGFTAGMQLVEGRRTLRAFCSEAARQLANVEAERIGLFGEDASLLFYLKRDNLNVFYSIEQIKKFQRDHSDGFLIADLEVLEEFSKPEERAILQAVMTQEPGMNENRGQYALLRFAPETSLR